MKKRSAGKAMMSPVRFAGPIIVIAIGFLVLSTSAPLTAGATPEYARQTGLECRHCHVDALGGGQLTEAGNRFLEDLKAGGRYRPLSLPQRIVRLVIGYLHIVAAIAWFGTILYVHVLLKPAYASKGLPKGELRLGWISMLTLLITGILLTIARMPSWSAFTTTRFGILLSIKIALYLIMLASAVVVTVYIGPRMRKKITSAPSLTSGSCTLEELPRFDGREGRPAYVAYRGTIYDMTKSRLWKNGSHLTKHAAGNDLTDFLTHAPHGEDKILAMPQVGRILSAEETPQRPFHERLFYFFAYMNLAFVFVVLFIITLWRWW
jgi:predicted heme/steroid binding protein/uncharacterized membrane protein